MKSSTKKLIEELCAALYELGEVADEAWLNGKQYGEAWEVVRLRWDAATAPIVHAAEKMGVPTRLFRVRRTEWMDVWVWLGRFPDSPPPVRKFRKFIRRLTRGIVRLVKRLRAINLLCQEAIPVLHAVAKALEPRAVMEKLWGETESVVNP
jgi:hypothetical protein